MMELLVALSISTNEDWSGADCAFWTSSRSTDPGDARDLLLNGASKPSAVELADE